MECPQCGAVNPEDANFCDECGTRLDQVCQSCGHANRDQAKYCGKCGASLETSGAKEAGASAKSPSPESYTPPHLARKILDNKAALEGERKQVTVMFADLKGSTALIADRDPEEADNLLKPIIQCMMESVHRYEGTVTRVMGDGIMALFGAPISHEDHALRACYSALAAHESMNQMVREFRRKHGINPQIRIGLNSGQVVVRNIGNDLFMEYTAMGETAHLAARMEELAASGSTLLTEHTFRHVDGFVKLNDLGPLPIKGITNPLVVYELLGVSPLRTRIQVGQKRGLTPFVGRTQELEALVFAMNQAGHGQGQIVSVSGEAGVGKTRLFYEFARATAMQDWLLIETDSVSYGKATAYLPVVGLLKNYCHLEDRDDNRTIREKVSGKLVTLDQKLMSVLPALLSLLSVPVDDPEWSRIDPPRRRERTLDAIKQLLLRESQVQPVCLVIENLHWIDSETQMLLDRLVEGVQSARLLLLTNYRPEYQHRWTNKPYYTQMRLSPLPADSAQDLLAAVLGDAPELNTLKQLLITHSGGNPFFLEEIVRTLVETEVLIGSTGAYSLMKTVPTIKVPDTVEAVLAARLDRLKAEDKHLLQSAAVIGMDVPHKLLAAVGDTPSEELASGLMHLQSSEFLYETNLFPEIEYTFNHALTHEVVYGSLLTEQRLELHARIADAIEDLYAERLSEQIDRLANHAFRGGQWERAIKYLRQASNKAADGSAYEEAANNLESALEAVAHLPEGQEKLELGVDIRFALRSSLQPIGEHDRAFTYLRQAEKLTLELEDRNRLGWASAYLCQYLWWDHDAQNAEQMGQRALTIASDLDDVALEAATNFFLGQGFFNVGKYTRTIERGERSVTLLKGEYAYERLGLTGLPSVLSRIYLAWALTELGRVSEAFTIADEAVAIATTADQAYSLAAAYLGLGQIHITQGAFAQAIPVLEGVIELCKKSSLLLIEKPATALLCMAYASEDRSTDALSLANSCLPSDRKLVIFDTPTSVAASGIVFLLTGKMEEAEQVATSIAKIVEQHGYRGNQAKIAQLLGDIYTIHSPSKTEKAIDRYNQAISLANKLQMKPLAAQCNRSLGLLHKVNENYEEARPYLTQAVQLFRDMKMDQWTNQSEQELKAVSGLGS